MSNETEQDAAGPATADADRDSRALPRAILVRASADRRPGAQVEVTVDLQIDEKSFSASSEGIGHETIELRVAAEATIGALHAAVGDERFQLVGIKRLHAFDADVVLVALRERAEGGQRFIGAVPVRSTLIHAAAAAVLDATNRILTGSAG
ncbi:MAG TPA: hypothetical protein VLA33_06070 [Gemmatimonadota bacterium]|nr:hypothetical protein [Gemmatimonadota bacterium]